MVVACALATGGCSRGLAKVGFGAGIALTGIGLAMQGGAFGPGGEGDPEDVAFLPLTTGVVLGFFTGLYLLGTDEPREEPPAPPSPPAPDPRAPAADRARARARAWGLTKEAAAVAREGDCAPALRIDGELVTLDDEFRQTVFARDAAVARCLARPGAARPTPAAGP